MDRKVWFRIVEEARDRYTLRLNGVPAFDGDEAAWTMDDYEQEPIPLVRAMINEAFDALAEVGREQLD